MRRSRIAALLLFLFGFGLVFGWATPAYADGGTAQAVPLTLSSWPIVLAGLCGVGSTHLTELLTHNRAPQWIKSGVNLFLTTLAGILITVQVVPGHTWKSYLAEIASAVAVSMLVHYFGLTSWVQKAVPGGVGADVAPLADTNAPPPAATP